MKCKYVIYFDLRLIIRNMYVIFMLDWFMLNFLINDLWLILWLMIYGYF